MDKIACPNCNKEVVIDISKSVSDDGEVFRCPHCHYDFRYVEK